MKRSELKEIIREEIKKVLNEKKFKKGDKVFGNKVPIYFQVVGYKGNDVQVKVIRASRATSLKDHGYSRGDIVGFKEDELLPA